MKFEIFLYIVIALILYDFYHHNKYSKYITYLFKKYYRTGTYIIFAIVIFNLLTSKTKHAQNMLFAGFDFLKYVPFNKSNINNLSSIIDITTPTFMQKYNNIISNSSPSYNNPASNGLKIAPVKRSVSEARKRYVASNQNWKCANCGELLNHTFEVDHITRLEYGGSNDISNLTALCRNCHGLKTSRENLSKFS